MKLGEKLRRIRKNQRLTLVEVSRESELSASFISDVERGNSNPSDESLQKLADCYNTTVDVLLEGVELSNEPNDSIYPQGFKPFLIGLKDDIDEDMKQLLLQLEHRSNRKPKTEEEWLQLYYTMKTILGQ